MPVAARRPPLERMFQARKNRPLFSRQSLAPSAWKEGTAEYFSHRYCREKGYPYSEYPEKYDWDQLQDAAMTCHAALVSLRNAAGAKDAKVMDICKIYFKTNFISL